MNDKHPLGRLIEDTKAANGWSDEYIAARASRAGFKSSKQNIGRIKNQPVTTVKADQIKLLAVGLDVPEITVARAAVASMGFPEIESSSEDLVEVVRTSPDLRDALLWATNLWEAADHLFVTERLLTVRVDNLTDGERTFLDPAT